jgi:hypothetical protein
VAFPGNGEGVYCERTRAAEGPTRDWPVAGANVRDNEEGAALLFYTWTREFRRKMDRRLAPSTGRRDPGQVARHSHPHGEHEAAQGEETGSQTYDHHDGEKALKADLYAKNHDDHVGNDNDRTELDNDHTGRDDHDYDDRTAHDHHDYLQSAGDDDDD